MSSPIRTQNKWSIIYTNSQEELVEEKDNGLFHNGDLGEAIW